MEVTDEEIVKRVQAGDRGQYLVLFDRYYGRVEAYARKQLRNGESARDIASETFLRAYRAVDGFRTGEAISYPGYLFMICRRLVVNELSRSATANTRSLDENPQEADRLPGREELPLEGILRREKSAAIRGAMESLSREDREIIQLAFEKDLSRKDIGEILGKPSVSAVTSHLHRAMQKLKSIVAQEGYFAVEHEVCRK